MGATVPREEDSMKAIVIVASYLLLLFIVLPGDVLAAHILEPLGTEIAATPPRGRMFGQVIYEYSREEHGTTKTTHLLPIEFEIGLGERTHLNGAYEHVTGRELDVTSGTDEVVNHTTWFYNVAPMFRAIPDRLMVLAELNGRTEVSGNTQLTIAPEVIVVIQTETFFALQNLAIKLAVPFGLNGDSPDI